MPIASSLKFGAVSVSWHACAITQTSDVYCWGPNSDGQVGDGTTVDRVTPVRTTGDLKFATITVGHYHTCGLDINGALYCWGSNADGQVGRGGDSRVPVHVAPLKSFTSVDAGGSHTCAIATGGGAYCWGANYAGQVGDGVIGGPVTSPTPVVGGLRFSALSAGNHHTCGLTTDGALYCWGANSQGQIGDASTTDRPAPTRVAGQR
jgi:alpha-tubulin suppressor-like RCC1 family protein